jgi:glycosyltransferase involved in cell wall biosynthesis
MRSGRPGATALLHLTRLLSALKPDLLMGWMLHGNLAVWAATKLLRREGPLAWTIRNLPGDQPAESLFTRGLKRWGAVVSGDVPLVVFNAWAGAEGYRSLGYRPNRTVVIPNGFDTERFRPRPEEAVLLRREIDAPPEVRLMGLIARHHPVKDHPTFLRAVRHVVSREPAVHAVLAGTGADEANPELTRWIEELGLRDRVHRLGPRADIERVMAGLDVGCLSSRSEGFPNVVGELMACGVPCVVTDVGDAARVVGDAGVVVPAGDPEALARGALSLLRLDPERQLARSAASRNRIVSRYSVAAMIASYDRLYKEMLSVWNRGLRSHSERG